MASRTDISRSPYLRLLLYGQPGSTKTRTAGTAALDERSSPVLWLDASGNPESLRDYAELPDVIKIEALKDVNAPYNWLASGQPADHPIVKAFDLRPPYKTVVVDQLTDVQRISFSTATGQASLAPGDFGKHAERRDFYAVLGQMTRFAKLYFELPMHVIMTCLEKTVVDETVGSQQISPLLWGQSDTEVPGYARIVGWLTHRATMKRGILKAVEDSGGEAPINSVAFFLPSGRYRAKDQTGRLGNYMVDPTITKMLDLIEGEESSTQ